MSVARGMRQNGPEQHFVIVKSRLEPMEAILMFYLGRNLSLKVSPYFNLFVINIAEGRKEN